MKLKSVSDLMDIQTLISCLYTIGDIQEENFCDCVSEPELGVLCDILEKKGKVASAADLYDSAKDSFVNTIVGSVFDAMGLDVGEDDKLFVYLWALGLQKTPSKINETFDDISTFGGVEGIRGDEEWEGTWEEYYETLISNAEIKECEDWLNTPGAPLPHTTPPVKPAGGITPLIITPTDEEEDFTSSTPSVPKVPTHRPKSTFKIDF